SQSLWRRMDRRLERARQQWALLRGTAKQIADAGAPPASRAATATPLEPLRFEALLETVEKLGQSWVRATGPVLLRPGGPRGEDGRGMPEGALHPRDAGEYESTGAEPRLTSPPLELWKPEYRYIVIRMAVSTRAKDVHAQVFWLTDDATAFTQL